MWEKMKTWFPPGYDYRQEWRAFFIILAAGCFISLGYLFELDNHVCELFYHDSKQGRILRPGAVALPFWSLIQNWLWGFGFPLFYGIACAVDHMLYYRRSTRSIYLMKRLPKRSVWVKSCFQGAGAELMITAAAVVLLLLLYRLCYVLRIPKECMPGFL